MSICSCLEDDWLYKYNRHTDKVFHPYGASSIGQNVPIAVSIASGSIIIINYTISGQTLVVHYQLELGG